MSTLKPSLSFFQMIEKRLFDLFFSSLIMVLILPIFICVAISIKLTSRGPVLIKTKRIGKGGETIYCYKFRTMLVDSSEYAIVKNKIDSDPRYTNIGKFLHVTALDELPQFLNVLEGSMSIVGPRALFPSHYNLYSKNPKFLDTIKPGITGPMQIKVFENKKTPLTIDEIIEIDSSYIANWSLWYDLKIVVKTIVISSSKNSGY